MISFSFLKDEESLLAFLKESLHLSGQQIKKSSLSKALLTKPFQAKSECTLPINLVNHLMISSDYNGAEIKVLFEDDRLIALSKPIRIHSYPQSYDEGDNLLSWLRANDRFETLQVNTSNYDRGLLYRLDYETSGLVILLKKDEDLFSLRERFGEAVRTKEYIALVDGEFTQQGEIIHYLKPYGEGGKMMRALTEEKEGAKEARLNIIEVAKIGNQTKLRIQLMTGHRHQIRVQLAALGVPIVGDPLYNGTKANRLHLQAVRYAFTLNEENYEICDEEQF